MSSQHRSTPPTFRWLALLALVGNAILWNAAPLPAADRFRRADANADGTVNLTDVIHSLSFLFRGSPDRLSCQDAADTNDDGELDVADPVRLLLYLFLGAPAPPPPFGGAASDCGEDPSADSLGCESFSPCPPLPPGPPSLVPPRSPTREPFVELRGTAGPGLEVRVTGGVSPIPVVATAGADGSFTAEVELTPRRLNRLFAVVHDGRGQQSSPASVEVIQDSEPPFVHVDEPADGSVVLTDQVAVTGRVADMLSGFQGLEVTVNEAPAAIAIGIGTNGTFERADLPLQLGENTITVVAMDAVGNTSSRELRVTREEIPADADRIELVSGNGQPKRPIFTTLPQPIVVRALKADGTPIEGKLVTFRVVRSDGRLASRPDSAPDARAMTLAALTDEEGLAAVHWTLGGDAGCGNNRVRATARGLAGEVLFCASASPGPATQINVGTGQNQRGEAGAPVPEALRAWVNDGCNGIPGVPVTFLVRRGTGTVDGARVVTVPTGPTGHAQVRFVLGPEAGNQTVEADFESNPGAPATFIARATLRGEETQPTTLAGLVMDNAARPIQGALCRLEVPGFEPVSTATDLHGRFALPALAAGPAALQVEGSFATHVGDEGGEDVPVGSFPSLTYEVTLVPHAETSLASAVLLPPLDPENAVVYDGASETVLRVKGIEGFEMRVAAGTTVTLSDRTRIGPGHPGSVRLSLNQVHQDDIPMPMPDGAAPPVAWTLQPRGAKFDPPLKVTYPNVSALPPGAIANFLTFNHDTGKFEVFSSGRVAQDGSAIESDPGSGISVAGWGGLCPPYPEPEDVKLCTVKVSPKEQAVCVGERVKFQVSGGPGPGTLTWITAGSPPTATTSTGEAFGSLVLFGDTSYATPGEKAINVFYECQSDTGSSQRTDTAKVFVVDIESIKATVPHTVNPSRCEPDPELDDDVFQSGIGLESMVQNPPLALPRRTKALRLEAVLSIPGKVPASLKWTVRRNADDADRFGPLPRLFPAGGRAILETDAQGSFHIHCYRDRNGNGELDAGESTRVLNLVLVGVEVTSLLATPHPVEIVQETPIEAARVKIGTGLFDFAQPHRAAIHVVANVLLNGGGSDGLLGTDKITVAFIQNFLGDDYTCHYPGVLSAKTVKEVFACDPATSSPICLGDPERMRFPVLDGDVAYPTGGLTAAASCCHMETAIPQSSRRVIEWIDSPGFRCPGAHPCGGGEALATTTGGNAFVALMVSFSAQAPHTYVLDARAPWTPTIEGTVAADGSGNRIWTPGPGAGITASSSIVGLPQAGSDAGIMVYGPTPIGAGGLKDDAR